MFPVSDRINVSAYAVIRCIVDIRKGEAPCLSSCEVVGATPGKFLIHKSPPKPSVLPLPTYEQRRISTCLLKCML